MNTQPFTTAMALILAGALVACAGDSEPQAQVDDLETQLAAVVAERDALLADQALTADRFDKTSATVEMINAVVSDPGAFGTEEEVIALLSELSAPGSTTHDLAYGEIETVEGWRNTLYRGLVEAETYVWFDWVCEDGSQAGSLWTWRGLNAVGDPFELIGVNLSEFNEEGLGMHQTVAWPYEYDHVYEEFGLGP